MTRSPGASFDGARQRLRAVLAFAVVAGSLLLPGVAAAGPPAGSRQLYGIAGSGSAVSLVPFDVAASGAITERDGDAIALGGGVTSVVVGRDGRTVYVGSSSHMGSGHSHLPGDLEVYAVAPDGSLALLQTIAQATSQLALTPDGSRLFVRSPAWDIVSFPVTADGSLGLPRPGDDRGRRRRHELRRQLRRHGDVRERVPVLR